MEIAPMIRLSNPPAGDDLISPTARRRRCLDFLARSESAHGIAPSFEETRASLGYRSMVGAALSAAVRARLARRHVS
jgi:hypothetical protein